MRRRMFVIVMCLLSLCLHAQISGYTENQIADYIQSLIGGQREVSVSSGRIDLLHNHTAFEVEWANNWKEAIGQSLWYALQSNMEAGIILILREEKDYKYFIQLNSTLQYAKLDQKIKVYLFPNDFEEWIDKEE